MAFPVKWLSVFSVGPFKDNRAIIDQISFKFGKLDIITLYISKIEKTTGVTEKFFEPELSKLVRFL